MIIDATCSVFSIYYYIIVIIIILFTINVYPLVVVRNTEVLKYYLLLSLMMSYIFVVVQFTMEDKKITR